MLDLTLPFNSSESEAKQVLFNFEKENKQTKSVYFQGDWYIFQSWFSNVKRQLTLTENCDQDKT